MAIILLIILSTQNTYAQGEVDSVKLIQLNSYSSFGVSLNSNGLGFDYKFIKYLDYKFNRPFSVELITIRHPKEEKITNSAYAVSRGYVFGKTNAFLGIRAGSGIEKRIVEKTDPGSIGIYFSTVGGISLGLLKPIYYQIIYPTGPYTFELHDELFNPETHTTDNIYSRSSFFTGINQTRLIPGIFAKAGFCFDYGKRSSILNRIELGSTVDVFFNKIELMALSSSSRFFFSLFASYRFGVGKPVKPTVRAD